MRLTRDANRGRGRGDRISTTFAQTVLYYAGLRRFEASALDIADVDLRRRRLIIQHGKGDKYAVLPISDVLAKELTTYLQTLEQSDGPLFPSRRQNAKGEYRIAPWTVWKTVKDVTVAAGLNPDEIWPHLLRHAFVSHIIENGAERGQLVDIGVVRDLARHSSVSTTSLYLQANPKRLMGAANLLGEEDEP